VACCRKRILELQSDLKELVQEIIHPTGHLFPSSTASSILFEFFWGIWKNIIASTRITPLTLSKKICQRLLHQFCLQPFGDGSITCTDGWTLIGPVWGLQMHNCISVNLVPSSTSLTDAFSIAMCRRFISRRAVLMGVPIWAAWNFITHSNLTQIKIRLKESFPSLN
jgi:hypothetical protein